MNCTYKVSGGNYKDAQLPNTLTSAVKHANKTLIIR